ncbi:hypothetical protein PIIN_05972 [Serendipita indica DSM 11827]|uniref:RING-type domain-containing protein n=1 Tax=Serendipita indica (strain DSM 11827) TaxID=1109443 RepID=G4TL39_SERID|nr:hypothetical protein PIIN_05972 [Serendipita indica DSM 11827]
MSSPTLSPRFPAQSPPFTPVRASSTRKSSSNTPVAPRSSSVAATMPLTPEATPVNSRDKNRFKVLLSPSEQSARPQEAATRSRAPLKTKSQNFDATKASDSNWRTQRKQTAPETPGRASKGNELLPSPFHSTQRRNKINQNNYSTNSIPSTTPVKTPLRAKKFEPLTPEDSPLHALATKVPRLNLTTPPKLMDSIDVGPPSPVSPLKSIFSRPRVDTPNNAATCAACNRPLNSAALLSPCSHLVCSSCLTGCLNAAGEKGMACMACKMPISTFRLTSVVVSASGSVLPVPQTLAASVATTAKELSSPASLLALNALPAPQVQPVNSLGASNSEEACVLRIDNVPWDVTPEMLADWIGDNTTAIHHHALIDRKDGRTLSYAYMEVTPDAMKAILRARQNKALMREMFPSWKGHFLGSRPCVAGLDNGRISSAFHDGLISTKEIDDVVKLLRKPDSHFVKVPTLPYYHLISILRKFPSDKDSKILHTPAIKKALVQMCPSCSGRAAYTCKRTSLHYFPTGCPRSCIFTQEQRLELLTSLDHDSQRHSFKELLETSQSTVAGPSTGTPQSTTIAPSQNVVDLLANTHNVSVEVVHALAQDLVKRLLKPIDVQPENNQLASNDLELPLATFSTRL